MASISKIRSDSDRISNLPNNLITHILSFLSTKDAVKTSALSTSWNQLWTLVPLIRFDEFPECSQSFVNFVNRVLLYKVTPLDLFQFMGGRYFDAIYVKDWIYVALSRHVRQLDVTVSMPTHCILPDSLFSSKTLVVLKLRGGFVFQVPEMISLESLKIFHFETFEFDAGEPFSRLILSCPILEELRIVGKLSKSVKVLNISSLVLKRLTLIGLKLLQYSEIAPHSYELVLDTPNLQYLKHMDFDGLPDDYHINTIHCLDTARFGVDMSDSVLEEYGIDKLIPARSLAKLFVAVSNVRFLDISNTYFEALYGPALPNFELPKFSRLISLRMPILSEAALRLLKAFLQSSPELKYLSFDINYSNEIWYPPTDVPFCLLHNVKVIEVSFIHPLDPLLSMVTYFLEKTNCLEELIIRTFTEQNEKFIEEVSMLPRASNSFKIVVP